MKRLKYIRSLCMIFAFCLGSIPCAVMAEDPLQMTFFGNNEYQPSNVDWIKQQGIHLSIINLDDHRNLENELSNGLPQNDQDKAIAIAKKRVKAIGQDRLNGLFEGVLKARRWGILRYPAVVFGDGKSVIYGVTDLQSAYSHWQSSGGF